MAHHHRSLYLVLGDLREDQPKPIPILTLCQLGRFLKNRSEHEAVVQDSDQVFVTSANLTPKALERNIEAGLLVRDRSLAQALESHFQQIIDTTLVVPLPPVP